MYDGARFLGHTKHIFRTLDRTIRVSREGRQELNDELVRLGKLHFHFGVTHRLYPILAASLIEALREVVGEDQFTASVENGFASMFSHITSCYMEGAFYEEFDHSDGSDEKDDTRTIQSAPSTPAAQTNNVEDFNRSSRSDAEVWA